MLLKIGMLLIVIFGFILTSETKKTNKKQTKPQKKSVEKTYSLKDSAREFTPLDYTKVLKQQEYLVENDRNAGRRYKTALNLKI